MKVQVMEESRYSCYQARTSGKTLYTISSTENLIRELTENQGYELIQLSEGVLGCGDCVLLAPDENHYNFVIREIPLNEWTSGQTIRRCARISKAIQQEIEAALTAEADE